MLPAGSKQPLQNAFEVRSTSLADGNVATNVNGASNATTGKRAPPRVPKGLLLDTTGKKMKDEVKEKGSGGGRGNENVPDESSETTSSLLREDVGDAARRRAVVASSKRLKEPTKQSFLRMVESGLTANRGGVAIGGHETQSENRVEGNGSGRRMEEGMQGVEVGAGAWALGGRSARGQVASTPVVVQPEVDRCRDAIVREKVERIRTGEDEARAVEVDKCDTVEAPAGDVEAREKLIEQMREENERLAVDVAQRQRKSVKGVESDVKLVGVEGESRRKAAQGRSRGVATSTSQSSSAHNGERRASPRRGGGHQGGATWRNHDRTLEIDCRLENAERLWAGVELASDIAKYARQAEEEVREEREARQRAERERDELEGAKWQLQELVAKLEGEAGAGERALYEVDEARKVAEARARSLQRRVRRVEEEKASLAEELVREAHKRATERAAASRSAENLACEMAARLAAMEDVARKRARREMEELRTKEAELRMRLSAETEGASSLREKVRLLEVELRRTEVSQAEAAAHLRCTEAAAEKLAEELREARDQAREEARKAWEEAQAAKVTASERESEARQICAIAVKLREVCSDQAATIDTLQGGAATNSCELVKQAELLAKSQDDLRCAEARIVKVQREVDVAKAECQSLQERVRELQSTTMDVDFLREALRLAEEELEGTRGRAGPKGAEERGGGEESAIVVREQAAALEEVGNVNERLRGDVGRLMADVEGLRGEGEEMREGLRREREGREKAEREGEDLRRRLQSAEIKANDLEAEVGRLREELGSAETEAQQWEAEAREARASQVEMVQKLKDSAQRLFEVSEHAEGLETELLERQSRIAEMEARDAVRADVSGAMEAELARLEKRGATFRDRVAELEGMNRELLLLQDGARAEIDSVASELATARAELDLVREEHRALKEAAAAREMHCSLLTEKLSSLEEELSFLNTDLQRTKVDLVETRSRLATAEGGRSAWDAEMLNLRRALTEARRLRLAAEQDAAVGREVVVELQRRVEGLTSKVGCLEAALEETKTALQQGRRKIDEMSMEAVNEQRASEELRKRVYELEEELLEKEGQIAILSGPSSP